MKRYTFFIALLALSVSHSANAQSLNTQPNGSVESVKGQPKYHAVKHPRIGNGNGGLNNSYYRSNAGLNYVSASVLTETRCASNVGSGFPATLNLSGLPSDAIIDTAFIYYAASYTEATPPACTISITNPASTISNFSSVNIGEAGPVCWGETGTVAYRAGVNSCISGNGGYIINISGFANADWEVDGVTLLIVYTDTTVADTGDIVLTDGCWSSSGIPLQNTFSGFSACAIDSSGGNAFAIAADIQTDVASSFESIFNGQGKIFTSDFWNFCSINTELTPSQNVVTYDNYSSNTGDCFLVCMEGLYFQPCGTGDTNIVANDSGCSMHSPPICYVTSDTLSQNDEVFWDKSALDTMAIDSFVIYRGVTSSLYVQVGRVAAGAYSSFIDVTSDPNTTSYFYELGVIDSCHTIHPPGAYNQSVFLQSSLGLGSKVNLNWNQYAGEPVSYYRILRDDSGHDNWHVLDSVPGLNTAYTDTAPPLNPGLRYVINTIWNISCRPSARVLPHSTHSRYILPVTDESYSNNVSSSSTGIVQYSPLGAIEIYPNPVKNSLTINLHNPADGIISLNNVLGQQVYTKTIAANSTIEQIDLSSYPNGIYFLILESQGQRLVKKVVKL